MTLFQILLFVTFPTILITLSINLYIINKFKSNIRTIATAATVVATAAAAAAVVAEKVVEVAAEVAKVLAENKETKN